MSDILLLLTGAILVNNLVLTQLLGVCPLLGSSGKREPAVAMAAMTTCVMTLSSIVTWLLHHYVLLPFDLLFLSTISYMLVIAALAAVAGMVLHQMYPALHRALGIHVLLLAANGAILGAMLLNDNHAATFIQAPGYGFGSAVGFSLVLILFSTMRERLVLADVPEPFRGPGIALVTAGLMSLAFTGFAGLV